MAVMTMWDMKTFRTMWDRDRHTQRSYCSHLASTFFYRSAIKHNIGIFDITVGALAIPFIQNYFDQIRANMVMGWF